MWLTYILLALAAGHAASRQVEVEDVTGRQLEAAVETEDILAVYWYTKNCKTCDRVLGVLERIGDDVAEAGVTLVRVNDKKSAKVHGVRNFPALSLIRSGDITQYEGDLTDSDAVLDFLTNTLTEESDGKIEQVTASELELLVSEHQFVAVFFYSGSRTEAGLNEMTALENLAAQLDIRLVCINDLALVAEYSLGELPALVYYRHSIPILYQGDMDEEGDILEWLVQNRNTGEEGDGIEEVEVTRLEAMISAVENIAVLFYDSKSRRTEQVLESLEKIDDDCDTRGVHFVKISSSGGKSKFGVSSTPTLVFFKNKAPHFYEGNLLDDETVLEWLLGHLESAEIEEVSASLLGKMMKETRRVVVVFCKYIAYAVIALTHTCYLIKNYAPDDLKKFLPPGNVKGLASES